MGFQASSVQPTLERNGMERESVLRIRRAFKAFNRKDIPKRDDVDEYAIRGFSGSYSYRKEWRMENYPSLNDFSLEIMHKRLVMFRLFRVPC